MDVGLSHPERQPLSECRPERHLVEEAGVHARDRNDAARPAGLDRGAQHDGTVGFESNGLLDLVVPVGGAMTVGFETDGVDAGVGTEAARQEAQALQDVALTLVDRLRTGGLSHRQSFGNALHRDDAFGAEKEGASDRELADGARAEDRDGVSGRDVAVLRGHPAGGEDVAEEEHLLVRDPLRESSRARRRRTECGRTRPARRRSRRRCGSSRRGRPSYGR